MADDYITRLEHNEFAKRMEDEHKRQNHRIDELEAIVKALGSLPETVKQIRENQEKQEKILEDIRNKPAERVNTAKQTVINTICSTLSQALIIGVVALIMYGLMK